MVVHDPKAELTLDELWKDAQDRFENITKQRLRASSVKRLDDVIKELDAKYIVKSSEDATIQNRTKRAVHNVLQCIQLLGGIAAQGASIVSRTLQMRYCLLIMLIGFWTGQSVLQRGILHY